MKLEILRFGLRYEDKTYMAGDVVEIKDNIAKKLLASYPEDYRAFMAPVVESVEVEEPVPEAVEELAEEGLPPADVKVLNPAEVKAAKKGKK